MPPSKSIKVGYLARVEGEASLQIDIEKDRIQKVQLQIFEPPRFFEAFLRGRDHTEAPDITARICGICPVAYQMSACHAIEDALGVEATRNYMPMQPGDVYVTWADSRLLRELTGFEPDTNFKDGVREFVDWYQDYRGTS